MHQISDASVLVHEDGNAISMSFYRRGVKRFFDLVVSLAVLPLLIPLLFFLALIIYLTDRSNPFFVHQRVGRNGRQFGCLKLRSMVIDAEDRLQELLDANPKARADWQENQKLNEDPRITRVGQILRKTSLDELPQFINVLRGDMSLVGPRPVVMSELARYGRNATAYLRLRPGLTGPWQTTGRNDVSYDERVQMDVDYEKKATMMEDLRILIKTFVIMLRRTGK